jgi:hypothetical protein
VITRQDRVAPSPPAYKYGEAKENKKGGRGEEKKEEKKNGGTKERVFERVRQRKILEKDNTEGKDGQ